jgi:TetR/AcrR family transcriptional repressor of nem operon
MLARRREIAQQEAMDSESDGTRIRIIDLAEALLMESGFNAISYQDVADRIGIRKASIHYHFPTKADLGAAVVARYIAKLGGVMTPISDLDGPGVAQAFEGLLGLFALVASTPKKVCLGGVLGAEFETLPENVRAEVQRFYRSAQGWLGALLERGRDAGVFRFEGPPKARARAILAMLEGALIVERVLQEDAEVDAARAAARTLAGYVEGA